jgi:sigma-B regulation protein RsbU (phosphoserine phosphatase)
MANSPKAGILSMLTDEIASTGTLQERILLIEDNEEAMFLVKCAIEEFGNGRYRLEWSNCLRDGLSQLSKGGVDLVLLDLGLPESSGPVTYDSVRAIAPGVPVLVLTGDAAEETELRVTGAGGEDYLIKDQVSGPLLLQAIQSALYANKIRLRVPPGDKQTA